MKTNIGYCGYSSHTRPFYSHYRTGYKSDEEINEFLSYLKTDYEKTLTGRQKSAFLRDKERDIAIISMMLGSGMRVSEISSLTLHNIDFQKQQINIVRKGDKEDTARVLPSALEY